MKTIKDTKREYVNPSIIVLEVEANGMLLAGSGGDVTNFETQDTEEIEFNPNESTSNPAL